MHYYASRLHPRCGPLSIWHSSTKMENYSRADKTQMRRPKGR